MNMAVEFKTEFSNEIAGLIHGLFFGLAEDHEYDDKEKGLNFLKSIYSTEDIKQWNKDFVVTLWDKDKFIGFGRAKDNGWTTHLYIDIPYEGQGLGSKLLNKLEEYLINKDHKVIHLNSEAKALDFYKKRGYEVDGLTKIHEGIIQIPMQKAL